MPEISNERESWILKYDLIINMVYYTNLVPNVKYAENADIQLFLVLFMAPPATAYY